MSTEESSGRIAGDRVSGSVWEGLVQVLRRYGEQPARFLLGHSLRGRRPRERPSWYFDSSSSHGSRGIVVGGSPRSGTTLTRVMLDSHRAISCGPESYLFSPDFAFNEYTLGRRFDLRPTEIRRWERDSSTYEDFAARFMEVCAARQGKQVWAEKTPRNVLHLGWVLDRFPNVVFLHVLRDGRAVVNSLRTHPRFVTRAGRIVPTNVRNDLDGCIDRWLRAVTSGLEFRQHPRVVELRYEDLVESPRTALEPVLQRLGLDWDPAVERHHEVRSANRDPNRFPNNQEATAPVDRGALEKWRTELSPEEVLQIESRGGTVLRLLGYI